MQKRQKSNSPPSSRRFQSVKKAPQKIRLRYPLILDLRITLLRKQVQELIAASFLLQGSKLRQLWIAPEISALAPTKH